MMTRFTNTIKRAVKYILWGIPEQKLVIAKVATISPNEMLAGRTALITGGTSGIGKEITKAFVEAGANCIITGRSIKRVEEACVDIDKDVTRKGKIRGLEMNVTNISQLNNKLEEILNFPDIEKIDILVNNAGIVGGEIANCTEEIYDQICDTNMKGVFFLTQAIARYMKDNHIEGNILNIGSSSSLRPATSAYTLTKNAVLGFTKGMAKILAPYGITVNGIAPGPTATPMLMPNGIKENIAFPTNSLGRFILPQEIASMAVVLVSPIGRSIIGDMVFMTGGSGVVTFDDVNYSF